MMEEEAHFEAIGKDIATVHAHPLFPDAFLDGAIAYWSRAHPDLAIIELKINYDTDDKKMRFPFSLGKAQLKGFLELLHTLDEKLER